MFRRGVGAATLVGLAFAMLLLQGAPAGAVFSRRPHVRPPRVRATSNTQLVMSSTGPGQGVRGFIADLADPFDPVADGYPSSDPTTGFTRLDEGFAGIIHARPPSVGRRAASTASTFRTITYVGIGYVLDTWDAANVPNVGYVARLLTEHYPTPPRQPPSRISIKRPPRCRRPSGSSATATC